MSVGALGGVPGVPGVTNPKSHLGHYPVASAFPEVREERAGVN